MKKGKSIGKCPICNREMLKGGNIDKHHWIPVSKGGTIQEYLHMICHQKIHSLWTNAELFETYNNVKTIKEHDEMMKFIKWISKKPSDFYERNKLANKRGNRRK